MPVMYQAKGTFTSGTGDIVPPLPTGLADGDLMILVVHSANETITAPTSPQTWTQITAHSGTAERGTAGAAGGVRARVFYRWWVSGDGAPTITDTGDLTVGQIYRFSGVDPTTPFDGATPVGFNAAAATSHTLTGITTGTDWAYVCHALALDRDGTGTANIGTATNANLAVITEHHDQVVATNNGGGLCFIGGFKKVAGASGSTSTSTTGGLSTAIAGITFSLRSKVPPSRVVQKKSGLDLAASALIDVALTGVTARNSLIAIVTGANSTSTYINPSISDSAGNTWTTLVDFMQEDLPNADNAEIIVYICARSASGDITVSLTKDSGSRAALTVMEVSGLSSNTAEVQVATAGNDGSHTSISTGALSPGPYMASYIAILINARIGATNSVGYLSNTYSEVMSYAETLFSVTIGIAELSGGASITESCTHSVSSLQGGQALLTYQIGGGFRGATRNIDQFRHMMTR